jgi:alpha-amylase/alpha-mannosidase (GH57 family)
LIGWECRRNRGEEEFLEDLVGKLEEKETALNTITVWRIILKLILKKQDEEVWIGFIRLKSKCWAVVNTLINFLVPSNTENLLTD